MLTLIKNNGSLEDYAETIEYIKWVNNMKNKTRVA